MASANALFSTSSLKAANAEPYSSMTGKLDGSLLRSLEKMGMEFMTPVQSKVLEMSSLRNDCLVRSKTGTGKTIAFLLPAIHNLLLSFPKRGQVAVLILSPTRELALQIGAEAERLMKNVSVQGKAIEVHTAFGGTARASSLNKLKAGDPKVLVATPGRLNDILGEPEVRARFEAMQTLILDEADAMLEAGFLPDVKRILSALPSKTQGWQGMCFSATIPPKIKDVLNHVLKPNYTSISTLDESEPPTINGVPQFSMTIPKAENIFSSLLSLLNVEIQNTQGNAKIIVFGTTANLVALYAALYRQLLPLEVFELHSRLNQGQRTKTTDAFKAAASGIMFATDVIGRGMDFPDISLIVQAGLPSDSDAYTHRVGRTARAGKSGRAVLVLTDLESFWLKVNRQFPITPHPASQQIASNGDSMTNVDQAMRQIDEKTKQKAYSAYLGFMKPFINRLRIDPAGLVTMANYFAMNGMGCPEPPGMEKRTIGKMGLKGVQGIRYVQPQASGPVSNGPGQSSSYSSAMKKRPGPSNTTANEPKPQAHGNNGRNKRSRQGKGTKNGGVPGT